MTIVADRSNFFIDEKPEGCLKGYVYLNILQFDVIISRMFSGNGSKYKLLTDFNR
jgi:hypothetical protein